MHVSGYLLPIDSYAGADAYLGRKDDRPLPSGHHTRLQRRPDGTIAVRLWSTDVVTYRPDGTARLDSGGWRTVTTKARMTEYTAARIASDRGRWYVYPTTRRMIDVHTGATWRALDPATRVPFTDGIVVDAVGYPTGEGMPSAASVARAERADARMAARIGKYVGGYMAAFTKGMPAPGGGDCWDCSIFDASADAGVLPETSTDHLRSHMTERYYVPSLAVNALRFAGYREPAIILGAHTADDGTVMLGGQYASCCSASGTETHGVPDSVRRAVRKYMKARLMPNVAR